MQLQFEKTAISCLENLPAQIQYQEQTQELRLPAEMADIAQVLGAWGQVLIRSKEWQNGQMQVSGGVMVWAMYLPEEGDTPQMVEAWLPFVMRWELPNTRYDGTIRVNPLLKSVDARSTSARKLLLRANVGVQCCVSVAQEVEMYVPEQIPDGVHLLMRTYPIQLPKEAGEKIFTLEEELTLPSGAVQMERLLRFSFHPELIDQKVLSGKVVFRGVGLVHILYLGIDEKLHSADLEVPFSQYSELEAAYSENAAAQILMALTALELDMHDQGQLRLKAGLTGQYLIVDTQQIQLAQDAYGITFRAQPQLEMLQLPLILQQQQQLIKAQSSPCDPPLQPVDVVFYPDQAQTLRDEGGIKTTLTGTFVCLGYDPQGKLGVNTQRWSENWSMEAGEACEIMLQILPSGVAQYTEAGSCSADILLRSCTISMEGLQMLTQLELEPMLPDPDRPSLILCTVDSESLWTLAKAHGSTEQKIREANKLSSEPVSGQILLIPVL